MRIVSPSVLSANFGHLEQEVQMLESSAAEWLHFDVMDGSFVPNISFGFPILRHIKSCTSRLTLDVHLMIVQPERYLQRFIDAGADVLTFHLEATSNVKRCIDIIRKGGAKVGLSIKPGTDIELLREYIPFIDLVLIMSVEPGFGGQSFIESSLDRAHRVKEMIAESNANVIIEMDGGLSSKNSGTAYTAGVDVVVAGSAIFKAEDPQEEILKIINS